ncbi:hypothetical protein ONZ43_g5699 [Nemania bipapillata]|uniref:Uncharacterized protein n=1 Tax=Nemania bipapillata TaxID=110536 RepID=A0ACC2I7H1_9PEZI|nr:hypothetical protein ONZ43_g5699 [Nemania bipapillata]
MPFNIHTISQCGRSLFISDTIFTTITIGVLGLRFWSAYIAKRKMYADDYTAVAAFVSKSVLTGAAYWGTFNGLGKAISELTLDELTVQVKVCISLRAYFL